MKEVEKLNKKIEVYRNAYNAIKACEDFEGADAQPFVARIQLGNDLTVLEDIKKDFDMGFISAEEVLERINHN